MHSLSSLPVSLKLQEISEVFFSALLITDVTFSPATTAW
jgi:hypothetical protein